MSTNNASPLIKSTVMLGIAIILSRITGFAREIVLASFYGAGTISDAFVLAFTIPDTLLVFISGAVAASFIPMYHRVHEKAKYTRNIMSCMIIIGLLFSLIFTIFPNVLVRLFAFSLYPETFDIAVFFVRYMVWTAVFTLLIDVFSAHLEINGSFFASGTRMIWRNASVIVGLVLGAHFGNNLFVALGPVFGVALSMFILSLVGRQHSFFYRPYIDISSPDLKRTLLLIGPIFLATAFSQINSIIIRNFAASLPVGTISYLNYSYRVIGLFAALLGGVLITVLFPHISKLAANNNIEKVKSSFTLSTLYITAVMLPIGAGLFMLSEPAIRIMFERGHFTAEDTVRTASLLRIFSFTLLPGAVSMLITRVFYALQNTRTPAYLSLVSLFVSIGLSFLLIEPLGAEGLALATLISGFVMVLLLLVFLRKKSGTLGLRRNITEFIKIAAATAVMSVGVWHVAELLSIADVSLLLSVAYCFVIVLAAAIVYVSLLFIMNTKIAYDGAKKIRGLLSR